MPVAPQIPKAPIRGAQSFVGIMGQVWHRPSLTALEIAWRWISNVMLFVGAGLATRIQTPNFADRTPLLNNLSLFQPSLAVDNITAVATDFFAGAWPLLHWLLPLIFLFWNVLAAFGRTIVLRRLDRTLRPRRLTLFILGTFRSALLLGAWWIWFHLLATAANTAITAPAARNEDPSVVLFAAMMIVGSLLIYCLWAAFSWFLHLAPLLAMQRNTGPFAALRSAVRSGKTRGKLIEINLVMNIVRIALIVLTMVFSASPLPFTDVATPQFLRIWWTCAILLYLIASDYFHVVRSAAYLHLYRVYNFPQNPPAPPSEPAS